MIKKQNKYQIKKSCQYFNLLVMFSDRYEKMSVLRRKHGNYITFK